MFRKLILLTLVVFFASQIQAYDISSDKIEKKYVSSEKICIEKDAIFVFLNNRWVQTPAIHSDSFGIYVDEIKFAAWQCSNCGRWTTGWFCCEHCGALPD